MPRTGASDQVLLLATEGGDVEAFGLFFDRYSKPTLRFVRERVRSPELAADITAETFAAALVATQKGRARNVPNGAAWLRGIARHKIVDSYRMARAEDAALRELGLNRIPVAEADLDEIDEIAGLVDSLRVPLDLLSTEERAAVIDRVVREREYAEMACGTGASQTTVRKRVSRGLARLRRHMRGDTPWSI
jgi:RNA polymerase sigma factor (sigma-70 family)